MKSTTLFITVLLLIVFTGTAFTTQRDDDPVKAEKKARIKMIKNIDGNVTEIDTVLVDFNPGDIDKFTKTFVESYSENDKGDSIEKRIVICVDGKGKHNSVNIGGDLDEMMNFDMSTICEGDSMVKKIIVTTGADCKELEKNVMIWKSDDEGKGKQMHVITKGSPHVKMIKLKDDNKVIRLDDPSVISFKKKDLGGNKEKIEIIREKPEENESLETK